ncbi:MAG: 2-oxo acid dehydrogenase subunit E2, partial [Lachnospiraceae bacterium]|nr:2-oxo acid dehydrogenase subunit E2 [Lachnospiraceae bacterium]
SCAQITAEMKVLAEKVRERTLTAAERSGGTFTVSSIGMYDADFFTPIINYPQTAIMGVGRIKVVPRYTDDTYTAVEPRHVMEIGLTYDHRIIDGGPAMRYMLAVRDALEKDLILD